MSRLRSIESKLSWGTSPGDLTGKRRRIRIRIMLAVSLPLLILLGLQYWWLGNLDRASRVAQKTAIKKTMDWAAQMVELRYKKASYQALSFPVALLDQNEKEWARHFREEVPEEAQEVFNQLFVISFQGPPPWKAFFFDPKLGGPAETIPISAHLSISYWELLAAKGRKTVTPFRVVDERDSENPIILRPMTDPQDSRLIGVAGAIVDVEYFKSKVLGESVDGVLQSLKKAGLRVGIWDPRRRRIYGDLESADWSKRNTTSFAFIFTEWTMRVSSPQESGLDFVSSFASNMSLSVILAGVLLAGTFLALRLVDRELALSDMKNSFVSNVSHELRTPLASIRAFAEMMQLGRVKDSEKVRSYGEYIETESRRLSRLIDNILDFSKIESGQRIYLFRPSHLEDIVEKVLQTFQVRLSGRGFRITLSGPSQELPEMNLDSDAMAHALANLLDNAVKYSNGNRRINVSLTHEQDEAVLAVKDHGIGISKREQPEIFTRFYRVGSGLVHDVKGSGLGLSIVQHIVEAHGGRVQLKSVPKQGSTFSIHLPLEFSPKGKDIESSSEEGAQ